MMSGVFALLMILDQWSKQWVASHFRLGESRSLIDGFLQMTLVRNYGAAFSINVDHQWSTWFFLGVSILASFVVVYLFLQLKTWEKLSAWGLCLIMSGAVGNIVDRIRWGYVVDFIDVYYQNYHWYVFNVADSCITVGAILYGIDVFFIQPKIKHEFPWDATRETTVEQTEKMIQEKVQS